MSGSSSRPLPGAMRLLAALMLLSAMVSACSDASPFEPLQGSAALKKRRQPPVDTTTPPPPPPTSSIAGMALWVDPNSQAAQQVSAWQSTRPADAAELGKIANRPQAVWFGGWNGDIRTAVSDATTRIIAAGALPVLVPYNIPARDCGGYSAGGANSPDGYRSWIRAFADGIGGRLAVVVLEPDALANSSCLTPSMRADRLALLSEAVDVLSAAGARVYLDIGHPRWLSVSSAVSLLNSANIAHAAGFSLNVANFQTTADNVTYGDAISAQVGGKHYVVDTSRNGSGPDATNSWCNPAGRTLGRDPSTVTGYALVDAFLWVKRPGESDGTCNGGPSAGSFFADWALDISIRTSSTLAYGG